MDWDDFRFVQAVASTGSVRGAGEQLQVHASTVTRHLEQLERRLGTRLFTRTRRGMEITAAGAAVIEVLDRVAGELEQVERRLQARRAELAGTVRLATPPALATHVVVPGLEDFIRSYPDIEVVLITGPAVDQLQRGQADLALVVTDDPPGEMVGRSLGVVMGCVYGARTYLSGLSGRTGRWVGSRTPASVSARVRARHFARWPPVFCAEDDMVTCAAVQSGLGIGLLPCYLGDAGAGLQRLEVPAPLALGEFWLLSRPEARGVARIQALSDHLQIGVSEREPQLRGAGIAPATP